LRRRSGSTGPIASRKKSGFHGTILSALEEPGIIITLLPILSETLETGNSRQSGARARARARDRETERQSDRETERRKERKQAGEEGFALGTRYIDRPYAMLAQWRGVLGR